MYQIRQTTLGQDQQCYKKQVDLNVINEQVAMELINLYDPNKGTTIDYNQIFQSQIERFNQAKNSRGSYPLFPGSALMSVLIRRYYKILKVKNTDQNKQQDRTNNVDQDNNNRKKMEKHMLQNNFLNKYGGHIVGTPGLGKTFRFLQIVYLHNLRVRHIIKEGIPQDSLFKQNYKFVYFNVETQQPQIKNILMTQIQKDFGQNSKVFNQMEKIKNNDLFEFFKSFVANYDMKSVRIRLIVDQVNILYSSDYNDAKKGRLINIWNNLISLSGNPGTLVSSKNNEYLQKGDPVLQILGVKYDNQNIIKVILDNLISPTDRLIYSAESLLFELDKQNIFTKTGKTAFSIVKKLQNQLPFLTHYSISKAVAKSISQYKQGQDYKDILKSHFQQSQDKKRLMKNILEFNDKIEEKSTIKGLKISLSIMANLMSFTSQAVACQQIKVNLEMGDPVNSEILNLESEILSRESKKQQQKFVLNLLKNTNFFFLSMVDNVERIYFSQSSSYLQSLRLELMNYFTIQFQKRLIKYMPQQALVLLVKRVGQVYQMLIFKSFYNFKLMNRIVETIIKLGNGQQLVINLDKDSISSEVFPSILNQDSFRTTSILKKLKVLTLKKSCFIRAADGNPAFDFLISTCTDRKLKLFFVDATVQKKVGQKNSTFIKYLSGDKVKIPIQGKKTNERQDSLNKNSQKSKTKVQESNFKENKNIDGFTYLIKQFEDNNGIDSIDIYFYVLKARPVPKIKTIKIQSNQQISTKSKQTIQIENNQKIQMGPNKIFETNKRRIQIGPNQKVQVGPDNVIQLKQNQALTYSRRQNSTIHIVPVNEIEVKDLTVQFQKAKIFSDKVKIKLTSGFIDEDFIFESDQKSDLSSREIVKIMKPALKHHGKHNTKKELNKY